MTESESETYYLNKWATEHEAYNKSLLEITEKIEHNGFSTEYLAKCVWLEINKKSSL